MNKAVLIYDGACPLCRSSVRLVTGRARSGELELLPLQAPERAARYPELSEEACRQAMHLVLPDGRVVAGSEALPEALARLRGLRWLSHAFGIPGVKPLARHVYQWVSHNRYALSRVLEVLTKVRCALRLPLPKKQTSYLPPTHPRYVLSWELST